MSRAIDLTGKRFGRLTGIEDVGSNARKDRLWHCRCDCGNEVVEPVTAVIRGKVISCGCARRESMRKAALDRAEAANKRREEWADSMVDEHHAKFYADGYCYIVSDNGEIYGPSGKLAQRKDNKGYVRFKQKPVHRIVALNFVPGHFDGAEVDHINAVRDDNRAEILLWVTPAENKAYARDAVIAANKARSKQSRAS